MSTLIQRNFAGGEITPKLGARVDTVKYQTGLKTMRNFLIPLEGGAENRPGWEYGEYVQDSPDFRYIPFVYSLGQSYILEFRQSGSTLGTIRFIKDNQYLLEDAKAITAITNTSPLVFTSTAHGYNNGDLIYVDDIVGGMDQLNKRTLIVKNKTANTYTLEYPNGVQVNSLGPGGYTDDGATRRVYTLEGTISAGVGPVQDLLQDVDQIRYQQSADVLFMTNSQTAMFKLTRYSELSWELEYVDPGPNISAPASPSFTFTAGPQSRYYEVTAVSASGEESYASRTATNSTTEPSSTEPHMISWSGVASAVYYNIYSFRQGYGGYIGSTNDGVTISFTNRGTPPNYSINPPELIDLQAFPKAISLFQQRLMIAGSNENPTKVEGSNTGNYETFTASRPAADSDAVSFNVAGHQITQIQHMLDLNGLILFTDTSEHVVNQDGSPLTPSNISVRRYSKNGISIVPPLVIDNTALYIQARGNIVRNLFFDFSSDGYKGNNMGIFASHLFKGYKIVDWAYQSVPNSIIWAVRDDGVLLGFTYIPEQQIYGWHRHDTDGLVKRVCVIPEGLEDAVYLGVERDFEGGRVVCTERMKSRVITDIDDAFFMDSGVTYDGRNLDPQLTMKMEGGTTWAYDELISIISSDSYFQADDVGKEIHFYNSAGDVLIRFTIDSISSDFEAKGRPNKTVPENMRDISTPTWAKAVSAILGLHHLEGKKLSIFADGYVLGAPADPDYTVYTVTAGYVSLGKCYAVIHLGLPYISDLETLNIDFAQNETMSDKKFIVNKVSMQVESSRSVYVGTELSQDPDNLLQGLWEQKWDDVLDYNSPPPLATRTIEQAVQGTYNNNGRVVIRQVKPEPVSILSISPTGVFSQGGR